MRALFKNKNSVLILLSMFFGALMLAIIVGGFITILPWYFMVAFGLVLIGIIVSWLNLAVGFYLYFVLLLLAPLLKLADLITVSFSILFILKIIYQGSSPRTYVSSPNLLRLIVIFIGWTICSALVGKFWFHNTLDFIYRDSRVLLYWIWLPLLLRAEAVGLINRNSFVKVIFYIAATISVLAALQYVFGIKLAGLGRISQLGSDDGVVRVQLVGLIFVTLALVTTIIFSISNQMKKKIAIPLGVLFVFALYVNFGRAVWIWTTVAVVSTFIYLPFTQTKKLLPGLSLLISIGVVLLLLFKPEAIDRVVDRIASVEQEGGKETSYGWRVLENNAAIEVITTMPIMGKGVGGEYRPWVPKLRDLEDHTRYIHNIYFFYGVKIGLPGLAMLFAILIYIWVIAYKTTKTNQETQPKSFAIAVCAVLPTFCLLNITQPELGDPTGVIYIVLIVCAIYIKPTEQIGMQK